MQEIKVLYDEEHQQPVVTSLQVAEDFGKQHKNVLESIRNLVAKKLAAKQDWFYETTYESRGKRYPMYLMNRDGFTLLVMGFNGDMAVDWKVRYIEAFNAMEKHIHALPVTPEEKIALLLQNSYNTNEKLKALDERMDKVEQDARLDPGQYSHIGKLVTQRIQEVKSTRRLSLTKKQNGLLYKGLNAEIKEITGVSTRSDLRQKHYERVCDFIHAWEPSSATMENIKMTEGRGL